jgi:4-amino-4-deoxy-L-arabinose transferase-like glycosyltransferase
MALRKAHRRATGRPRIGLASGTDLAPGVDFCAVETQRYQRIDYLLMLVLALFALAVAVVMAWGITERIPHLEDEITYLFQARTYARGALWAPVPFDKSAFFTPFVLNLDSRRVGKYAIGWPLLLAVGERLGAGWLVNPILGALTVALTYALARDLFDRETGVMAGLLALTSPLFLIQSGTYMSHAASCLWTTLLMWAFLHVGIARDAGRDGRRWAALAGASLGMVTLTRTLTAIAVGFPFVLILLIRALRRPRGAPALVRVYWPFALLAILIAGLQPLYLAIVTGSPTTNLYTMVWPYDRVGFGPEFGRFGHTLEQALFTARNDLILWSGDLFGWPHASWAALVPGLITGVVAARPRRKAWPFILAAPFVLLVIVYLAYWVGARVYGPRYYYEGHAGLAILTALGLQGMARSLAWLYARLRRKPPDEQVAARPAAERRPSDWQFVAPYLLLIALLALNMAAYMPRRLSEWRGVYGITRAPLDDLEKLRQTDRVLVVVRGGHWYQYGALFYLNSPWYDDPIIAAHDLGPDRSPALIAHYPDREVWFYKDGVFSQRPFPYDEEDEGP